MKTSITLCLILILLPITNASAQSTKKTRRSNPQANVPVSTDFSKFVGIWEFISDPSNGTGILGKGYFKVTEQQAQKFKFIEGTEYQGNITWTEVTVKNADGIYLKPLNGKLTGRFTSSDFRATHGYDLTFQVTLSPEPNGKLLYSVCIGLDCEKYHVTKISDGEDAREVKNSSNETKSNASRKTLAEKSWQTFWTKFSNAIYKKDFKTLVQLSSADDEFFDSGGDTSLQWFEMMSSRWNLVKKAVMSGTRPLAMDDRKQIERITVKYGDMIFRFEKDNNWRFAGVMGD